MCQCLGGILIKDGGNRLNHENVIDNKKPSRVFISCNSGSHTLVILNNPATKHGIGEDVDLLNH